MLATHSLYATLWEHAGASTLPDARRGWRSSGIVEREQGSARPYDIDVEGGEIAAALAYSRDGRSTVTVPGAASRSSCFMGSGRAGTAGRPCSTDSPLNARCSRHASRPPRVAAARRRVAPTVETWADAVEAELDAAGFERPDIAGNSLGGWLALELAKRGRARTVVGIAPAGMFTRDEWRAFAKKSRRDHRTVRMPLPLARRLVRTPRGRRC